MIVVNASAAQLSDLVEAGNAAGTNANGVGALGLHLTLREDGRAAAPAPAVGLLGARCATVVVEVSDGARKDIARLQRVLLREAERAGVSVALGCGQSLLQQQPQFYCIADLATFALEYAEGAPNIFAMVFFCIDELYETRAVDMLQSAFDAFPDRDYCIVTVPHTAHEPPLFRIFSRVDALPGSTFSHVLYVCHRFSLLALREFNVRRATSDDFSAIASSLTAGVNSAVRRSMVDAARAMLVDGAVAAAAESGAVTSASAEAPEALTGAAAASAAAAAALAAPSDVRRAYERTVDSRDALLVAEVEGQVVGALVLRASGGSTGVGSDFIGNDIAARFNMPDLVAGADAHPPSERAAISNLIMNPIFKWRRRFFIQEAMRLERKALVAMQVFSGASISSGSAVEAKASTRVGGDEGTPFELLEELVPLDPREKAQRVDSGAAELAELEGAHCMSVLTRRLLAEPKRVNNARVVVVGTSDTALALVNVLLSVVHLHLPNLTLLIESELPRGQTRALARTSIREMLAPRTGLSSSAVRAMALERRCRVLRGHVVGLDRGNKCVQLAPDVASGERWAGPPGIGASKRGKARGGATRLLPYDMLVLAPDIADVTRQRLAGAEGAGVATSAAALARQNVHFLTDSAACDAAAEAVAAYGATAALRAVEEEAADVGLVERVGVEVAALRLASKGVAPAQAELDAAGPCAVVYGSSLMALSATSALLASGVPSREVIYLRCAAASLGDSNTQIMERVDKAMAELGVRVVDNARLVGVRRAVPTSGSGAGATTIATFAAATKLELAHAAAERKHSGSLAARKHTVAKQQSSIAPYASSIAIGQLAPPPPSKVAADADAATVESDATAAWPLDVPCGIVICADRPQIDPALFDCIDDNGACHLFPLSVVKLLSFHCALAHSPPPHPLASRSPPHAHTHTRSASLRRSLGG